VVIGPAGADGALVLTSASQLLFATLTGDDLRVTGTVELGGLGLTAGEPACLGPDRRVAIADPETLTLTVVSADRAPVEVDVPDALGECAWLDDGRLLVVREGDRLSAVDPATGNATIVTGGIGRHPSAAGGLLSLVDRSGPPRVIVRRGVLAGSDGLALGRAIFVVEAGAGELIARAGLSPDGGWLAVEVIVDPESAAIRRLRLYRVEADSANLVREIGLGAMEQVIVLPAR
jgi:hypothetical protein